MFTPEDLKAKLEADITKTELELKAKRMLLKQASKVPSKPFIETKFARGINHVLAFITTPCAATNHNARMRLDRPKAYRAEVAIERATKVLGKCEDENREVGEETNKLAAMAALQETLLSEFEDLDEYRDQIEGLREALRGQVSRLRSPAGGPAADVASSISDLVEQLKKGLTGDKGGGESPA